ncbi:hypothetical protein BKA65DRAFT_610906 [Rhexocercosporidium sp. MPI-PUGE-AT-0058]|nr:hypothetical protein BKA65DRAFT_610906 [Rhexocercosporidium sp. MPI-PUGE-AT-0058]
MATASELEKIRSNPIKEEVGAFRRLFESTCTDLGVALSSDTVQIVFSTAATAVVKSHMLDLILALQNQLVSRILRSQIGDRTLASDLSILYGRVDSNQLNIALAIPLIDHIYAVFKLVARTNPLTPPTAFEKAVFDTPLRSSSASQRGIKQTHDKVDQRILEELTGRVYYDIGGFYERYFEGMSWTNNARDIYKGSRAQYTEGRWSEWPEPLPQEHKQNPNKNRSAKTLVQLAGYTREVFKIFDRSKTYNSKKFDIHKEPERFIKVLAGYTMISDIKLGLNTFIKRNSNGKYIVTRDVRISLKDKPIASTKAIVCQGTTWYIMKFAWPFNKRQREGELLNLESSQAYSKTSLRKSLGIGKRKRNKRLNRGNRLKRSKSDEGQLELDAIGAPKAGADSLTNGESKTYGNRVHYCLITLPAGRPLHKYQSNNIIITVLPAEAPKGRLIDLDLAKELDSMPSEARHRTGTMQFMAIEVLKGKGHIYRHDLESFFYVFVWMTYTEIANIKQGYVVKNRFKTVIAEFSPKFENLKPLARELRTALFPIRDGDIFTGTFHDHNIIYDGMIDAFSRAIDRLGEKEQAIA